MSANDAGVARVRSWCSARVMHVGGEDMGVTSSVSGAILFGFAIGVVVDERNKRCSLLHAAHALGKLDFRGLSRNSVSYVHHPPAILLNYYYYSLRPNR